MIVNVSGTTWDLGTGNNNYIAKWVQGYRFVCYCTLDHMIIIM